MSAVSSAPVFGDIVSTAEATPAGFPLYTWGNTANGRLGRTPTAEYPANRPARMGDGLWIASSTAASGAYAINASGHLYAWGAAWSADQMGQGGINPGVPEGTPMRIGTANNWVQVSGVANGVSAINSAGHLYTWGANSTSPTGFVSVNVPTRVGDRDNWIHVVRVGGSGNTNFAINDQGHLYSWGTGNALGREVTAAAPAHLPGRVGDRSDWINVDGSSTLGVGVTEDGEIYSWGTNTNGLGRAVTVEAPANRPGRVGDRSDWVEMVTSFTINVAAINEAGELWTWGEDAANGQLGRPATAEAPANRPGRVGTASNWVTVAGGNSHFLAINTAGELWGWGNNSNGQVGDGTSVNRLAPEFVVQTTQASHAARGSGTHSMMLIRTTPAEGEGMLTKNLDMPYGTPTPDLNFTFIVAAHSFNGNTAQANLLPTIPNRVVSINNTSESGTSAGITTLTGEIDVLAGILFSQSGVFSYTVTEQQNTSGATSPSTVTYSQAQYRLNIYVQQDFEAPGEVFEIVAITVYRHINDNGTAVAPPEKDLNGLIFTNQYRRTTSGTTEYPGGLRLTKTVAGEFADRTTPFDFDVTLTRTAMCPPTSNFQARIYNADGTLNSTVPITSGVSTH
ncbi:MAG: hypothetical protein FWC81_03080, partial [Coriobacteriia bacterium]|nr:hypothetical protein [Coriobacteriia bacterium]